MNNLIRIKTKNKEECIIKEIWKDIKDYEGLYQVSNFGNVRSLNRHITRSDGVKYFKKGRLLVQAVNNDGYHTIKLCKKGKQKTTRIHQLVAQEFLTKPNDGRVYEVNHIDCNRTNNRLDNLEYLTHYENIKYSIDLSHHVCTTNLYGTNNPNYGNHILREKCKDKEYAIKHWARKGKQNGMAKKVAVKIFGEWKEFDYIGECCQYLKDNNYTKSKINGIRHNISKAIKTNKKYLGLEFKFL